MKIKIEGSPKEIAKFLFLSNSEDEELDCYKQYDDECYNQCQSEETDCEKQPCEFEGVCTEIANIKAKEHYSKTSQSVVSIRDMNPVYKMNLIKQMFSEQRVKELIIDTKFQSLILNLSDDIKDVIMKNDQ